jgi:rare lipoprotein A
MRAVLIAAATLGLAACASAPEKRPEPPALPTPPASAQSKAAPKVSPYAPAKEDPSTRGDYVAGGLYKPGVSDSTPDHVPDVDAIPEPAVIAEPRSKVGNRSSYSVLGKTYRVLDDSRGYVEQGIASYYGQKFHGRRTSNLEVYDMYAFTAAHKTLPLPSFVRVTRLDNGESVVVRVNDRGPFHAGRVIDLSYAAAVKLGITHAGVAKVEVRALHPDDPGTLYAGADAKNAPAMGAVDTKPSVVRSALDRLVAAIPGTAARRNRSAAGMTATTATVIPAAAATQAIPAAVPSVAEPLPELPAVAPVAAEGSTPVSADRRFDMHQNGRPMSADEFDVWMKSRQLRVATGRPTSLKPGIAQADEPVASPTPVIAAAATITAPSTDAITLQVASFAARANADRALALLQGAGIDGVRLHDGHANGQSVWRLRIGPLAAAAETELAAKLAGLGFGPPRRVRD